jgi:putative colanic acid biosynthesis UDP-glucose lipid carrier transferase
MGTLMLIFNVSWAGIVLSNLDLNYYLALSFSKPGKNFILNVFLFSGVTYLLVYLLNAKALEEGYILIPIILFFVLDLILFQGFLKTFKQRNYGDFTAKTLIIGAGEDENYLNKLAQKIKKQGYGIIGLLDDRLEGKTSTIQHIGEVNRLPRVLEEGLVDELFINTASLEEEHVKNIIDTADYYGIRVNLISKTPSYLEGRKSFSIENIPVVQLRTSPLDQLNHYMLKSTFDFFFALTVLIILSPILLLISFIIALDGKGSVFYTPMRKGEGGRNFKCYKFRTMSICDDPVGGKKSTVKNDPRITKIGKYLRKYDLDELPQFINVLKGDMSVIGPRPHRIFLQQDFRKVVNEYMVRHYVKPGISGWAQVNGWRGPTTTDEQKRQRIKHDIWYIENWSFWLDIKIVFLTVFSRKTRKNAF